MSKGYEFSKEWLNLFESAITYQENLKVFFNIEENSRLRDLKEVLRNKESVYYALKIVENVPDNIIQKLLNELVYVVLFGNVSNSFIAKKIILNSNRQFFRKEICKIVFEYSKIERGNIDILKDIALFLYALQYKKELLQFVDENISALKESEFIENEEDLKELFDMEDLDQPKE